MSLQLKKKSVAELLVLAQHQRQEWTVAANAAEPLMMEHRSRLLNRILNMLERKTKVPAPQVSDFFGQSRSILVARASQTAQVQWYLRHLDASSCGIPQ